MLQNSGVQICPNRRILPQRRPKIRLRGGNSRVSRFKDREPIHTHDRRFTTSESFRNTARDCVASQSETHATRPLTCDSVDSRFVLDGEYLGRFQWPSRTMESVLRSQGPCESIGSSIVLVRDRLNHFQNSTELFRTRAGLGQARLAKDPARNLPPTTGAICVSLSTRNALVSSPIWTIESPNESHGPWLSRTPSIAFARHCLTHSQNPTEF